MSGESISIPMLSGTVKRCNLVVLTKQKVELLAQVGVLADLEEFAGRKLFDGSLVSSARPPRVSCVGGEHV